MGKNKFISVNQFYKYLNLSKYIYFHIKLDRDKFKPIINLIKIGLDKKKIINKINFFIKILINIYFILKIIDTFQVVGDIRFDSLDINKNIFPYCEKLYMES